MSYYQNTKKKDDAIDTLTSTDSTQSTKAKKSHRTKKPSKEEALKRIIGVLDNRLINPKDFTVDPSFLKELDEIIESIHKHQCKAKSISKKMYNFCQNNKDENDKVLFKQLRSTLESVLNDIERYSDKVGEIFKSIADKYLRRLCRIMKRIESCHCHGFVPLNTVLDNMNFVHLLIDLLNGKMQKIGEFTDVSTLEPFLNGKCCQNSIENIKEDPECSDENENILKYVMKEQMNKDRIDLITEGNYKSTNEKYVRRLSNQHTSFTAIATEIKRKLDALKDIEHDGTNKLLEIDTIDGVDYYKINHATPIDYDNLNIPLFNTLLKDVDMKDIIQKTTESEAYKKLRNSILDNFNKTESVHSYIKTQFPITCPCTFFKNERAVEKTMVSYIELFRFGKYLWAYIFLKTIADELSDATFAEPSHCKSLKDYYFKDQATHDTCMNRSKKDNNIKYNFNNDLFQKYFAEFLHDERLLTEGYDKYDIKFTAIFAEINTGDKNGTYEPIERDYNARVVLLKTSVGEITNCLELIKKAVNEEWYKKIMNSKTGDLKTAFATEITYFKDNYHDRGLELERVVRESKEYLDRTTDRIDRNIKTLETAASTLPGGTKPHATELIKQMNRLSSEVKAYYPKVLLIFRDFLEQIDTKITALAFGSSVHSDSKNNGLLGFGGIFGL